MKKSIIDESLKELDDSYINILDNMDGARFKKEAKDSVLLSLDSTMIDKMFKGMLNLGSKDINLIYDRVKYMPREYIRFINIINDIMNDVCFVKMINRRHYNILNKIIIYGDLSYGFICEGEEFRCDRRLSFDEFLILQDIMIELLSTDDYNHLTLTLSELDVMSKMVNIYIDEICKEEKRKCMTNAFKKAFVNIRNKFRGKVRTFCDIYIKIV